MFFSLTFKKVARQGNQQTTTNKHRDNDEKNGCEEKPLVCLFDICAGDDYITSDEDAKIRRGQKNKTKKTRNWLISGDMA
jgi:hypothetical protein